MAQIIQITTRPPHLDDLRRTLLNMPQSEFIAFTSRMSSDLQLNNRLSQGFTTVLVNFVMELGR